MENKIILIEDDEEIRSMVKDYLSGEFQVLPCYKFFWLHSLRLE